MPSDADAAREELQFDRVVTADRAGDAGTPSVVCGSCNTAIQTEYYDINGVSVCGSCRTTIEALGETPTGVKPLVLAGLFGFGAGLVGAAIYYAVMAIANLEIGLIAILIGYMVGYSVRRGAGGRGGLRFQILGVALTYLSVAIAYTPVVLKAAREADRTTATRVTDAAGAAASTKAAVPTRENASISAGTALAAFAILAAFILSLPVLVVVGSMPSGLISAAIIFFGMRQAWRMTGAPALTVLGPYRVGAHAASVPA